MSKTLTFIATAYDEPTRNMAFLDSMDMQTDQTNNWTAIVWQNGGYTESMFKRVAEQCNSVLYKYSEANTDNWGTANRQQAIQECTTDYIIQTSVQDYWLPQAIQYILDGLNKFQPDILLWNSINHVVGPCQILEVQLAWSKLDWGNFAIKTDIAKKVGINHGNQYCADWLFIQDCLNSGLVKDVKKINAVLTIHN